MRCKEGIMNKPALRLGLAVACLLLAACQDRREPVKPTVTLDAVTYVVSA
jgi:outer membrane biogenesis lipoprotein LolB